MNLQLTTRASLGVSIIDGEGKMVLGDATGRFRHTVRRLVQNGSRRIVFNLEGVKRLDSSALGELVAAHTAVTKAGGEMKLLHLGKRGYDLLVISKLHTVFEVYENEDDAIASFFGFEPVAG